MSVETLNLNEQAAHARMAGRVCLITGGGSGIGQATALKMAAEGAAAVVIAGRRAEEGEAVAEACRAAGAKSLFVRTDVTQDEEVEHLVRTTVERFGRLDVAFNNAGYQERPGPLETQSTETFDAVFDTNVRSVFVCLKQQLAVMLPQGSGRIVINTSVSGVRNPNPGFALYSASKAAVISLMRSAAMTYASRGVRINAVAPGRVVTDMMKLAASGVGGLDAVAAGLPLRRMGEPEEVAEAVVWLASDQSAFVVGHVLATDGGFLAA
ncbi:MULTISPECIES: SDR family NAD(P)-dependent oxidoreductase [unclassified Mesorhizobium]|uniref:SDR family NAD(P)-dependent oxidoreductase n=1 Tax=unclassified Mesorhizobium TaxID=325217 RepID=UPI0030144765